MAVAGIVPPRGALKVVVPDTVSATFWFPLTEDIEAKVRAPPTVIATDDGCVSPDRLVVAFTSRSPVTASLTPLASDSVSPLPLPKLIEPALVKVSESSTTEF